RTSTRFSLASLAARSAAAWLCGTSSIGMPSRFSSRCSASARIRPRGATITGWINPASRASITAHRLSASQGWTTAVATGDRWPTLASKACVPLWVCGACVIAYWLVVAAHVVDHLAVIGQTARGNHFHVGAKLGYLAHRVCQLLPDIA